ncbi:MAG: hypothetical protein H0T59_07835 [Chloroflexi bacterium]|nr:hypothetical protein [Chloroflexota bacterium]
MPAAHSEPAEPAKHGESGAGWSLALELGPDRSVVAGSKAGLAAAIKRGADLRVYTEFVFEEHIVPGGNGDPSMDGLIREVIDFRETILVDDRHVGAVTTLRQPLEPPFGFNGPDPKLSFFMYTGDGEQAHASLVLGDHAGGVEPGERRVLPPPADMPKMSAEEYHDFGTTGPSRNFVYDMERYRYFVRDEWDEVLAHDERGGVVHGSFDELEAAQVAGREIRVGIADLARGLSAGSAGGGSDGAGGPLRHEVFSNVGSGFLHTGPRLYAALTHPLVRVAPAVPLRYASGNWDVAWVFLRTDGLARVRRLDPYTRRWDDRDERFACRWFAR